MIVNTQQASRTAELTFAAAPLGFDPVVDYRLDEVEGAAGLYALRDTVGAGLRLYLTDPRYYVPEYAPVFTQEQLASVDAASPADVQVYVVTMIIDRAPIVNLLGPIIVNPEHNRANQVILEDTTWPVQAELTPA